MTPRIARKIKILRRQYDRMQNQALVLVRRRDVLEKQIDKLDDKSDRIMDRLVKLEMFS